MNDRDSYQTEYTSDPYEGHTAPPQHHVSCGVANACGDALWSLESKETTPVGQPIRISSPPRRRRAPQTNSGAAPLLIRGGQDRSARDVKTSSWVMVFCIVWVVSFVAWRLVSELLGYG